MIETEAPSPRREAEVAGVEDLLNDEPVTTFASTYHPAERTPIAGNEALV